VVACATASILCSCAILVLRFGDGTPRAPRYLIARCVW
jgi:hypothetical protein